MGMPSQCSSVERYRGRCCAPVIRGYSALSGFPDSTLYFLIALRVPQARRALRSEAGEQAISDYHINVFYSDEDSCYIADIPDLEACSALGSSPEEALAEVERAKDVWLAYGSLPREMPAGRSLRRATARRSTRGRRTTRLRRPPAGCEDRVATVPWRVTVVGRPGRCVAGGASLGRVRSEGRSSEVPLSDAATVEGGSGSRALYEGSEELLGAVESVVSKAEEEART
jgi:predicted RNase H-like HicB family nuclease